MGGALVLWGSSRAAGGSGVVGSSRAAGGFGAVGSSRAAGAQGATDGAASIDYGNIGVLGSSDGGKHRLWEYRNSGRLGRGQTSITGI